MQISTFSKKGLFLVCSYPKCHKAEKKGTLLMVAFNICDNKEPLETFQPALRTIPAVEGLLMPTADPIYSLQPALADTEQLAIEPKYSAGALDAPLPAADLSTKTYNALLKSQITTIRQFCALELRDLMWLRNFGKKALAEIAAYRAQLGFPMC